MKKLSLALDEIASTENLLEAWEEFIKGKRDRPDVQEFSLQLMSNIISLHRDILSHSYRHGPYRAFNICDPKPRSIHKASVRDRLLHHALYRKLYTFFDRTFIAYSYSCRTGKGTHKALDCFRSFACKESINRTKTVWILKCDIKKFFANIDHGVILGILENHVSDKEIIWLLREIIESFSSTRLGVGLPLGNLTSQILVNIYMNEFDQFAKHKLKARYYIRYADDFVIFSRNKKQLENLILEIRDFLREKLKLELHPDKVFIKTLASGVDFLGWVHFTDHRVLRTATKRRMMKRMKERQKSGTMQSYLGLLRHGNTFKIKKEIIQ